MVVMCVCMWLAWMWCIHFVCLFDRLLFCFLVVESYDWYWIHDTASERRLLSFVNVIFLFSFFNYVNVLLNKMCLFVYS